MSVDITGLNELLAKLTAIGGAVTDETVVKAMRENMADLKTAAVALAPQDTTTLEKSGKYRVRKVGTALVGEVSFNAQAGDGFPYAVYMHEGVYNLGPKSDRKPFYDGMEPGRKYLSRPFRRYLKKYVDNLAEGVNAAIKEVAK